MSKRITQAGLVFVAALAAAAVQAQDRGTYTLKHLLPETALKATRAALEDCRKRGYQVAVAVVDRSGVPQAMMRDRFAGPHTPGTAIGKGFTAVTFRTSTLEIAAETQPGKMMSGIRQRPDVVAVGGGVLIEAGGSIVGGIGVSGAPTGEADELCAKAGIAAIRDDIEL
ncbi:MAG: heme-binding protein [Burkholderiales bacterium]|nr:heme-binding protein [Burkholderiales bacterium]